MDRLGGLGVVAIAAFALLGMTADRPARIRVADPPWDPPPCPPGSRAATAGAWFVVEPVVDAGGTLVRQRLRVGSADGRPGRSVSLATESFASGPVGGRVLVGEDDGTSSRLRLLDPAAGCAMDAGASADVIRGAVVDAETEAVFEHRVDRGSRADLGIWRRPLDGHAPTRVLPPVADDDAYGPTFGTELALDEDGRLAVASCAAHACRVRVIDTTLGPVRELGPTGPLLGFSGDEVVAYAPCPGLPCDVEALDPGTGRRRTVAEDAGVAALAGPAGTLLVDEMGRRGLRTVEVATGRTVAAAATTADAVPVRRTSSAGRGAEPPIGWVALAEGDSATPFLVADPLRLDARPLPEVAP